MIGRRGERGSGISVLAARHDDDDDEREREREREREKKIERERKSDEERKTCSWGLEYVDCVMSMRVSWK